MRICGNWFVMKTLVSGSVVVARVNSSWFKYSLQVEYSFAASFTYVEIVKSPDTHITQLYPKMAEADPSTNTMPAVGEKSNAGTDSTSFYQAVSTFRAVIILYSIVVANCFCSALICLCLWGFSRIDNIGQWQKRSFNVLSILLSTTLGFGIGLLFNQIGLLARGTVLGSTHSVKGVCCSFQSLLAAGTH